MALKLKSKPSRILAAIDGSDVSMNAAAYAITIAKNSNAEIFVINIVDLSSIFKMLPPETKKQLIKIGRQDASRMLDNATDMAKQDGMDIKTEIIESATSSADAIIKYAKEKNIDLIVVGTKGRSGMSKVLLGSVASKVLTYAPCPVLVVR
jgi:nucleotide-binding universal stress UspA family protein